MLRSSSVWHIYLADTNSSSKVIKPTDDRQSKIY